MVLSKKFYQGYLVPRTGVPLVVPVPGPGTVPGVPGTLPWYQACVAGEYFWARLVPVPVPIPVPVPVPVYLVHWLYCVMLRDYTTGKTS